ncbi:MAG TPA: SRPBCC family protein, partial [Chitinophagaceae bacterium]
MKIIKTIGILLIVVVAIVMIIMLILPAKQHIERTITINAPVAKVYQYLTSLENFNKWTVWGRNDSTLKNTITGTDGSLGAINAWSGDPELSGEGKIEVTSLEINKEIAHAITFLKPRQMNAHSEFDLEEINGHTRVRWQIDIATPRPRNILNLFSNMDKKMANDFALGLQ